MHGGRCGRAIRMADVSNDGRSGGIVVRTGKRRGRRREKRHRCENEEPEQMEH